MLPEIFLFQCPLAQFLKDSPVPENKILLDLPKPLMSQGHIQIVKIEKYKPLLWERKYYIRSIMSSRIKSAITEGKLCCKSLL